MIPKALCIMTCLICLADVLGLARPVQSEPASPYDKAWNRLKATVSADYRHLYTRPHGGACLLGLGIAGALAHTNADRSVRDWYQESVRSSETDDVAQIVEPFGGGRITVPVFVGAALVGTLAEEVPGSAMIEKWGRHSLRMLLIGVPPLLMLQNGLGAARPSQTSEWQPFEEDHGASGHSFMGAVPFLAAAGLTDHRWVRAGLLVGSTLCGLSRLNDDKHYDSQVTLGWGLAYLAARSVWQTNTPKAATVQAGPVMLPSGIGVGIRARF
jgi:hypothetical protein